MSAATKKLEALRKVGQARVLPATPALSVGLGTCGIGNGAKELYAALAKEIEGMKSEVLLRRVGCFGFCAEEPLVMAYRPGKPLLLFTEVKAVRAKRMVEAVADDASFDRLAHKAIAKIESWDFHTSKTAFGSAYAFLPNWNELSFFKGQLKLVLRDAGLIDPESIEEYLAVGGYSALEKALGSMDGAGVIEEVKKALLRGRGGAGYPTWKKWDMLAKAGAPGTRKVIICNADEGDPGAYMNRNEIESDPHSLVEGMILGAYATGASEGIVYARAEYPLAVERLRGAVLAARAAGLLGKDILGSKFGFDIEIVSGAGAFVCGEETALIASAEGKAGRPLPRPPYPAERGLEGAPTNINNVETWCNIPLIVAKGGQWFASHGTKTSTGTKVFSLVGKVKNTGLVELPLGTKLESMIYGMGGGAGPRKRIKAIQSGGPSGGCIPATGFGTSIDYEELAKIGAIMGSGGMVAMDQDNCMVDVARYFTGFTAGESCGKCTACREGLAQMHRILQTISAGEAKLEDLDLLQDLAETIRDSALCGLGQTAANPVLTTLQYFREEYERHITEKRCEAGVCEDLYHALCENSCPLHMNIPGYLQLLKENRIEDAFELTLRENPFPGTIGRICRFHCRMRCRRDALDEPVGQGEIHRYLADTMYQLGREKAVYARLIKEKLPPTGKSIAIVGAGPAGLAAAFWLVRLGHRVRIYDASDEIGGIPRWGIPAYRLPRAVLAKETGLIKKLGVEFVMGTRIGKDLSWKALRQDNDALLISVGAHRSIPLGIPGEDIPGVMAGCDFLAAIAADSKPPIGYEVIIVGGGNSAIDAARSAVREGARVTVIYRRARGDMPADIDELEGALEEGIEILAMTRPVEILVGENGRVRALRAEKMKPGAIDWSGRPIPEPSGECFELPCTAIIVAVGERVEVPGVEDLGIKKTKDGRIVVDPFTLEAAPSVWAAGDVVTGPATASEAMGLAKRAAKFIDLKLTGGLMTEIGRTPSDSRWASLFRHFEYRMEIPLETASAKAGRPAQLSSHERVRSFVEISRGYTGEQARIEADRCLRCDVRKRSRRPLSAPVPESEAHLSVAAIEE
ncbi:MAG: NADH-ubiquinone oxidoreductase-F iron-sulfur binding region domain-containing protein [Spirochaetota bacterium]